MKNQPLSALPRYFKNLTLDDFQSEAIWNLGRQLSTLVSAPTGTGKTVIADFLVDACIKDGRRVVYTAPVKALVNQKYRNYSRSLGRGCVGILTGDISENPGAPVLVMTTEVFRNMVVRDASSLGDIAWVIFDEIHYLDHAQRGTVWEEAILFMPKSMRLLGLSATVPNVNEIADWIENVSGSPVAVVTRSERAVPLEHLYYNQACGAFEPGKLKVRQSQVVLGDRGFDSKAGLLDGEDFDDLPRHWAYRETTEHGDLVSYAARSGLLPCLYFVMSRKGCEEKARELAGRVDYTKPNEKEAVRVAVKQELAELKLKPEAVPGFTHLNDMWRRGIAFHHAGMLPATKQIVEALLERRLLKVLYATETFAVGVNMPVRTVCFDSLKKYDGLDMRYLTQSEYFQMAGRAGRRGFDRKGTVLALIDFSSFRRENPPSWNEASLEPIVSHMRLSYNIVANMAARFADSDAAGLLHHSLAGYQTGQAATPQLLEEYKRKKEALKRLGYMDDKGLLPRGEACRSIYVQEILLTELIFDGTLAAMGPSDLATLAAALVYEPRPGDAPFSFKPPSWLGAVDVTLSRANQALVGLDVLSATVSPSITPLVAEWTRGRQLLKILHDYPVSAGDFVSACRRAIDLLRQIGEAVSEDPALRTKINEAILFLDRDVVSVHL